MKYRVPCYQFVPREFGMEVEADSPNAAIEKVRQMLTSTKKEDRDAIDRAWETGEVGGTTGVEVEVAWDEFVVEEVSS